MNRRILTSLLIIGVVGAFAAGSTFALFNDAETSEDNTFAAGALDLKVDWNESYNGEHVDTQEFTDNPGPIFNISDVKPGDHGEATVSLHLYNNPGYIWMNATQTANLENGCTDPEREAENGDCGEEGELDENMYFTVWEDDGDNVRQDDEEIYFNGTAEEFDNSRFSIGSPEGTEAEYDSSKKGDEPEQEEEPVIIPNSTTQYVGIKWWVPRETGNEIQSDSAAFDFVFYAEQARHNNLSDINIPETDPVDENESDDSENDSDEDLSDIPGCQPGEVHIPEDTDCDGEIEDRFRNGTNESDDTDDEVTGDVRVNVGEMYFQQAEGGLSEDKLEAEVGDKIVFYNEGDVPHFVDIDRYDVAQEIEPGESVSVIVNESANETFVNCGYHANHNATLTVASEDQDSSEDDEQDPDENESDSVTEEAANIEAPEPGDDWYEAEGDGWISYENPRDEYHPGRSGGRTAYPGSAKMCFTLLNEEGEPITGETLPDTQVAMPTSGVEWHSHANPFTAEFPLTENYERPLDSDQYGTTSDLPQGDGIMDSHCIEIHLLTENEVIDYSEAEVTGEHAEDVEVVGYIDRTDTWSSDINPLEAAEPYSNVDGDIDMTDGENTHGEVHVVLQLDR